jgi:hypothetical protein
MAKGKGKQGTPRAPASPANAGAETFQDASGGSDAGDAASSSGGAEDSSISRQEFTALSTRVTGISQSIDAVNAALVELRQLARESASRQATSAAAATAAAAGAGAEERDERREAGAKGNSATSKTAAESPTSEDQPDETGDDSNHRASDVAEDGNDDDSVQFIEQDAQPSKPARATSTRSDEAATYANISRAYIEKFATCRSSFHNPRNAHEAAFLALLQEALDDETVDLALLLQWRRDIVKIADDGGREGWAKVSDMLGFNAAGISDTAQKLLTSFSQFKSAASRGSKGPYKGKPGAAATPKASGKGGKKPSSARAEDDEE